MSKPLTPSTAQTVEPSGDEREAREAHSGLWRMVGGPEGVDDERDPEAIIRELRKRIEEYETVLRVVPIGISIAKDPQCKVIVSNRHHASLLGHRPDENTSIDPRAEDPGRFRIFRDGVEIGPEELPMHRAIAEKREIVNVECDVITGRGERLTLIGHSAPLFDDDGNVRGAVGAFDNITARKVAETKVVESERRYRQLALENARLYEEAQTALRMRDAFVATVSHELRSPIASILVWTGVLGREAPTPESLQRALEAIERSARRQARLIDDLLDMSRIATGQLHVDRRDLDLAAIVCDSLQTLATTAEHKSVKLSCEVPATPVHVNGDPDRLHQVVWNLVSNAIKFAPRGVVRLEVRREGDQALVRVSDNGQGIAPDFLPCVFDQFRQAPGNHEARAQGLGLGLAIVRHIVELHGGRVVAHSEGEGKGATFEVWLPLARESSDASPSNDP